MRPFIIAFAMYSKIPMPRIEWTEENMKYAMCFFPLIGAVIGLLEVLVYSLCELLCFGEIFRTSLMVLMPVLVTGGIHVDGFIDTMDARSSWGDKEKKREILKDSHVGAFGIIGCVTYYLVLAGAYSEVNQRTIWIVAAVFVFSRAFSGLASVTFPLAKKDGLLADFAKRAQKKKVCIIMYGYLILCAVFMIYISWITGLLCIITGILTFGYYRHFAEKEFGGNSGDLAGYFLQLCELFLAVTVVTADKIVYYL